jgi:hypothetical protein
MILLSKEEYKIVEKHIKTITTIIKNHSCSFITPEFRSDIKVISNNHDLKYCLTCNSGLFNICAQIYAAYVNQRKKKKVEQNTK